MLLTASVVVSTVNPPALSQAQAVTAPPAAPTAGGPLTRPDTGAARLTARATGRRVEVLDDRTDTTQVFVNPDGTLTMTSHARPVRVKRENGSWAPIDTTLVSSRDGITPTATPAGLTFSPGGRGPLVSITDAGTTMTVSAPAALGAMPAPTVAGDSATYPDVLPGVDLRLTADEQGYSEVLIVKTAAAATNPALRRLTFPTTVSGGHLKKSPRGDLQVLAKATKPVFVGVPPRMWDSSAATSQPDRVGDATGPRHSARQKRLRAAVTAEAVTVTPDTALLKDPTATFPVFIDPGVTVNRSSWSLLESDDPDSAYYNTSFPAVVGTYDDGDTKFRSLFGLATKPLNGTHVQSAAFRIHETGSWDCDSMPFELWSTSAISSSTTWNNPPSWNSLLGTQSSGAGGDACPAGDVSFPITSQIQTAANSGSSTTSLGIRVASTHESDSEYYKEFDNSPVLDVTYNTVPTQPRGLTLSDCYVNCADPRKVSASRPQFSAIVKDGDAGQRIQTEFRVRQGSTIVTSGLSNAGTNGAWVYWTPSTALSNGQSYTVSVRGYDGVDYSSWSADSTFSVDTGAPAAAGVSSSDYPAGSWSKRADQAGNFTLGTSSDFAGFVYGLDENPPTTPVQATSGAATISLTPDVDGPHTLYVRSRDAAGNYGPLTSHAFNVGQAALTLPRKGQEVTGLTNVQAVAPSSASGYTLQWRRADTDSWATVPASDVTVAATGAAVTWPQTPASGAYPKLTWDVAKTFNDAEPGVSALNGPVQTRALLPGTQGDSAPLRFSLDQSGDGADTADIGPGSVNLVTGNYAISATDVGIASYKSDLTVGRTFNTRKATAADPSSMFGPGWVSTAAVTNAGSEYTGLTVSGTIVQVGTADGSTIGFTAKSGGFTPELGYEQLTLAHPDTGTYTLSDLDGNSTRFTVPSGSSAWKPTSVTQAGSGQTTTMAWETVTVAGVSLTRPTRILAPVPAGVTCGSGVSGLVKGCRALSFTYAGTSTATATTPGDYLGRVSQISFTGWDPDLATPAMSTVPVARYAYSSTGQLIHEWDPRLDHDGGQHLAVTYGYDGDGILNQITPVAEEPWQFAFTTVPGDTGKGRLKQVSRSALSAGTATTTVVYKIPTTGTGAPFDLSGTQTARWGQLEPPAQATAVFGPDQVPDGNQAAGALPSSWTRAHITYLDASGQSVNSVEPGGYTTTTWLDATGNVTRSLTAGNRGRALDASTTDTSAAEAALAERLSTKNVYEAGGRRLKESFGPEHDTAVPDGSGGWVNRRARDHTAYTYDAGAPSGGTYDLVTTAVDSARLSNGSDADPRTTTTGYDWNLLQPTSVTTDPGGLNLTTRTTYDATTGLTTSTTAPAGGTTTTTPRTTQTVYYSGAANSTYSECGGHAEWANLPCRFQAGGTPSAGQPPPVKTTTYNLTNEPRIVTEKTPSGMLLRTASITYDAAARPVTSAVTASAGTALPTTKIVYEASTGRPTQTQSLTGTTVTAQIERRYDGLGRPVSYLDADGNTSTTTYDLLSRPVTTTDGKGTQTRSYDGGTERRGLLTQIVDSQAGTVTAAYDADARLSSQGLPNTLGISTGYDETGTAVTRSTSEPGCTPQTECIDLDEQVTPTAHGQWATHSTDLSGQQFTYDKAARLTQTQDYAEPISGWAGCTTRSYGFDAASNRTSYSSYGPADGGDCQSSTAAVSKTSTYDTGDRITTAGYTYDALGRTTTLPSADTSNDAGNVTTTYHVNDLVRSITQAGVTTTYTLDVNPRRIRSWSDGTTTSTNHFGEDGDSPSWTAFGAGYNRNIIGPDGALMAVFSSAVGAVRFQIADLHGDILGVTGADLATEPGILATFETDENGVPRDTADVGDVRYGYVGAARRASDNPAGLVLMGARLYNPATGRFQSTDPIPGGSANAYDYCNGSAVACTDIAGTRPTCTKSHAGTWVNKRTIYRCHFSHADVLKFFRILTAIAFLFAVAAAIHELDPRAVPKIDMFVYTILALLIGTITFYAKDYYDERCTRKRGVDVTVIRYTYFSARTTASMKCS